MEENNSDSSFNLKNGRTLGYAEFGDRDGMPVLYFHGLPSSRLEGGLWHRAAIKSKVHLIAPDRPGIGLSTHSPGRKLCDYPKDISALLQHLDISSVSIIGVSGGGPYALACAADPDLAAKINSVAVIAGLVSPELTSAGMNWFQRFAYVAINTLPASLIEWFWGFAIGKKARNTDREVLRRAVKAGMAAQSGEDAKYAADEEVVETMTEALRGAFAQGEQGYVEDASIVSRVWGISLESITTVPVAFWYGGKDTLAPPRAGELMAKKIPGAIWKCYDDDSHTRVVLGHQEEVLALLCKDG